MRTDWLTDDENDRRKLAQDLEAEREKVRVLRDALASATNLLEARLNRDADYTRPWIDGVKDGRAALAATEPGQDV